LNKNLKQHVDKFQYFLSNNNNALFCIVETITKNEELMTKFAKQQEKQILSISKGLSKRLRLSPHKYLCARAKVETN